MRSGTSHQDTRNTRLVLGVLGVLVAHLCLAACPRLPPPATRARAQVISIERSDETLRATLAVDLDGRAARVSAVDWEISRPGGPPLLRGRTASLELTIALPPALTDLSRVRLRGAIHLREGRAAATFDHIASLR